MPRVYLTENDRERGAAERLEARRARIIRVAAARENISLRRLARECGLCYTSLTKRVNGVSPFDLPTLTALTRYFRFDPVTALALLGGQTKSPLE